MVTRNSRLRVCLSKFEAPQTIFIAIFELSGVENPYKQWIFSKFVKFEILKKVLCLCVGLLSNLVFVEIYRLLDYDRYAPTEAVDVWTEVVTKRI